MPDSTAGRARRTADYLAAGHVDGALLVSLHGDDPLPARLAAAGIPMVLVGRPLAGLEASYVDVDNRQGAQTRRRAPDRRRPPGHRHDRRPAGHGRRHRPPCRLPRRASPTPAWSSTRALEATGDFTQESGAAAMKRLLADRPDIDAVFAASDLMAAGALSALAAAGRRVPDDVAIVGYDDSPVATSARPALTSVRQPIEEMGREVARLLIDAVEGADRVPRRVILATELIGAPRAPGGHRPEPAGDRRTPTLTGDAVPSTIGSWRGGDRSIS